MKIQISKDEKKNFSRICPYLCIDIKKSINYRSRESENNKPTFFSAINFILSIKMAKTGSEKIIELISFKMIVFKNNFEEANEDVDRNDLKSKKKFK